ncbi:Smr/MutS family protein [Emticicia sp. 17c]|uniref:Smr/MutS family protein n=1 Tax=Emticicia sp. 17c TaxID=3127704 RepID=UPI00301D11E5
MNIGDRVRLVHSKEEGIITKFLKDNLIEVEIETGFRLPVLRRELAVVSGSEKQFFKPQPASEKETKPKEVKNQVRADKGIFLAFLPANAKETPVYLVNNTDWDLPFTLTLNNTRIHTGLLGGILKAKSFQKSPLELSLKEMEEWGSFSFQAFYYQSGPFDERAPLLKKMRVREETFANYKTKAPLLDKEAFLYQLDSDDTKETVVKTETKPLVIDVNKLKEGMLEKKAVDEIAKTYTKPTQVVDLHIEQLTKNFLAMNNAQILEMQMSTFENNFEQAIASGMDEITFIHGVGNGILRQEIQRRLSKHKNVAWFEDAQKEKFGYGATRIKIK